MDSQQMGLNEWLLIAGAVVGPILAVQAQKAVEAYREGKEQRKRIFHTLMGTRQDRVSVAHVGALNSIDLAFYGNGLGRRPEAFQAVITAWADYRTHLSPEAEKRPEDGSPEKAAFDSRAEELFVNLLDKMAVAVGYKFARKDLQTGSYSPEAHGHLEQQQQAIRNGIIGVLLGERPIPMSVKEFPADPALTERAVAAQEALAKSLADFAEVIARQNGVRPTPPPPPAAPAPKAASPALGRALFQDDLTKSKESQEDPNRPPWARNPPKR